ncbi:MAG: hypothetical protein ACOCZU_06485 [Planctomycetota bacterium]
MGTIRRYFRSHPWQRRAFTVLLVACLGSAAAVLLVPIYRDYQTLATLREATEDEKIEAMNTVAIRALNRERFMRHVVSELDTPEEEYFYRLALILDRIDRLGPPHTPADAVSRLRAINFLANLRESTDANAALQANLNTLRNLADDRENNHHVQRVLSAVTGLDFSADPNARRGELAAVTAAVIGDADTLRALLRVKGVPPGPSDGRAPSGTRMFASLPRPQGAAAVAAGLAKMHSLQKDIEAMLASSDWRIRGDALLGLSLLDPNAAADALKDVLGDRDIPAGLRDRALWVAAGVDRPAARQGVRLAMAHAIRAGSVPPAMGMSAAAALKLDDDATANQISSVLTEATDPEGQVTQGELIAACRAARKLDLAVFEPTEVICRVLWAPSHELAMVYAARLLGRTQLYRPAPGKAPTQEQLNRLATRTQLLRRAANWTSMTIRSTTRPSGYAEMVSTPRASAAAGVGLWLMPNGDAFERDLRETTRHEMTLPGDYVAWHLAERGGEEEFALAMRMLPPLTGGADANGPPPVYNVNERSAGAMLMALSAGTDAQRASAIRRIRNRLAGGAFGPETDFFAVGSYRCALLILGERDELDAVVDLRKIGEFPQRRCLTALLWAGHRPTLDWLLWKGRIDDAALGVLLIDHGVGEVLQDLAPNLPVVDPAARGELLWWQLRSLRYAHVISPQTPRPAKW